MTFPQNQFHSLQKTIKNEISRSIDNYDTRISQLERMLADNLQKSLQMRRAGNNFILENEEIREEPE